QIPCKDPSTLTSTAGGAKADLNLCSEAPVQFKRYYEHINEPHQCTECRHD
ncbi:hypothetical protein GBF38_001807, partial [Nibea albiflora]